MFKTSYAIKITSKDGSVLNAHYKTSIRNSSLRLVEQMTLDAKANGYVILRDVETGKPFKVEDSKIIDAVIVFERLPDLFQERLVEIKTHEHTGRHSYYTIADLPLDKFKEKLNNEFQEKGKLRLRSSVTNQFKEITTLIDFEILETTNDSKAHDRIIRDSTEGFARRGKGGKLIL